MTDKVRFSVVFYRHGVPPVVNSRGHDIVVVPTNEHLLAVQGIPKVVDLALRDLIRTAKPREITDEDDLVVGVDSAVPVGKQRPVHIVESLLSRGERLTLTVFDDVLIVDVDIGDNVINVSQYQLVPENFGRKHNRRIPRSYKETFDCLS